MYTITMSDHTDVTGWTTDDVASWLQNTNLSNLVDRFSGKVKTLLISLFGMKYIYTVSKQLTTVNLL